MHLTSRSFMILFPKDLSKAADGQSTTISVITCQHKTYNPTTLRIQSVDKRPAWESPPRHAVVDDPNRRNATTPIGSPAEEKNGCGFL